MLLAFLKVSRVADGVEMLALASLEIAMSPSLEMPISPSLEMPMCSFSWIYLSYSLSKPSWQ